MLSLSRLRLLLAAWFLTGSLSTAAAPPPRDLALPLSRAATRLEAEGKPLAALNALLSLVGEDAAGGRLTAEGDPQRKLSPSVWAREFHAGLLERAAAGQRKALTDALAGQWRGAWAKTDVEAMRRVIALVGVENPFGREARLQLAGRLGAKGYQPEADQLLQEVRGGPDPVSTAKAVLALAEMMTQVKEIRDASAYYRILGREYAKVPVLPDKTGADLLADLAADKRFNSLLEKQSPVLSGRFKLRHMEVGGGPLWQPRFTFPSLGDAPPFLQRRSLTLLGNQLRIQIWDVKREYFRLRLVNPILSVRAPVGSPGGQCLGHIAFLNLGEQVVSVDAQAGKILWQYNILSASKDGSAGRVIRLEHAMLLTPTRLCLATKKGLTALDPLTGKVRWSRSDVPLECRLFNDGAHVFVVRLDASDKITGMAAFRLRDGAPTPVKDFSALYGRRRAIVDGRLLLWEADAKAPALRLYDVAAGKDVWRQKFQPGARPIQCADASLAGVVEPKGDLHVIQAGTKKPVLSSKLADTTGLDTAKAIRLIGDGENFYLAIEGPPREDVSDTQSLFLPSAGLQSIPLNGILHAFHRTTGRLLWYQKAENQMLLVSEIERLPLILLASRWNWKYGLTGRAERAEIRAFNKRDGKLWYSNDNVRSEIMHISLDHQRSVKLIGTLLQITLTAVPE